MISQLKAHVLTERSVRNPRLCREFEQSATRRSRRWNRQKEEAMGPHGETITLVEISPPASVPTALAVVRSGLLPPPDQIRGHMVIHDWGYLDEYRNEREDLLAEPDRHEEPHPGALSPPGPPKGGARSGRTRRSLPVTGPAAEKILSPAPTPFPQRRRSRTDHHRCARVSRRGVTSAHGCHPVSMTPRYLCV